MIILFYSLWNMKDWIADLYKAPKVFIVDILKCGLVTFLIDVVLYVLYELLKMAFIKIKWFFFD